MSTKQRAKINRAETAVTKVLPLVLVLTIFFNKLPFLPIFSGLALENLLTGIIFLFVAGAFAFEMQKTRKGTETNFGTILLAIFVVASLIISLIFFINAYDFGSNRSVDILIGIYFFSAIVLLMFQSAKEIITGTRAKVSKKEKA